MKCNLGFEMEFSIISSTFKFGPLESKMTAKEMGHKTSNCHILTQFLCKQKNTKIATQAVKQLKLTGTVKMAISGVKSNLLNREIKTETRKSVCLNYTPTIIVQLQTITGWLLATPRNRRPLVAIQPPQPWVPP